MESQGPQGTAERRGDAEDDRTAEEIRDYDAKCLSWLSHKKSGLSNRGGLMDVVWILMTFLVAKQPTVDLAFKTQAACEHMIAALSDPTYQLPHAKSPVTGYKCIKVPVQSE